MSKTKHRNYEESNGGKHVRNHIKSDYDKKSHKKIDHELKKVKTSMIFDEADNYDDDRYLPHTY